MSVRAIFAAATCCLAAPAMAQTPPLMVAPPPPVPPRAAFPPVPSDPVPVRDFAIVMTMGNETLWRGTLKVGGGTPGRISSSEAADISPACAEVVPTYGRPGRQVELSLFANRMPKKEVVYTLSARYSRVVPSEPCNGTRAVSIDQRFVWDGTESLRFEGDGGLRVTIAKP